METNLERWRYFLKDIVSPDTFINAGGYYLVSAFLQRRVWVGPPQMPIFGNQYLVPVGRPGVGKGLVVKQVAACLKHHKLKDWNAEGDLDQDALKQAAVDISAEMLASNNPQSASKKPVEDPLLVPIAADSTTYESLVSVMAKSTRRINYTDATGKVQLYTHCSLAFSLEELSSLFKKKAEAVTNFMLVAYDCGDYTHETKTQGVDRIRKCCLNFFGGTTPKFMESAFNDSLLDDGFASRTIFVFENNNRHNSLFIKPFNVEQVAAREHLLQHLKKLTKLYGQVTYTPDAETYLNEWWDKIHPYKRPNNNLKLESYYARKNIHIQKMAMAFHFMEKLDMVITLEECQAAMKFLDLLETKMHYALNFGNKNPLAPTIRAVRKYLTQSTEPQTFRDLWIEFIGEVSETDMTEVMRYLTYSEEVQTDAQNRYYIKPTTTPTTNEQPTSTIIS